MEVAAVSDTGEISATNDGSRWYTVLDVLAKLQGLGLDVNEMVVYRLIGARRFPGVKFGRRIYLRPAPVDEFLAEAATTDTLIDIATWEPKSGATPAPEFLPEVPGSRATGEEVA